MKKKNILLKVIERDISDPEFFNNIKDAKKALASQFKSIQEKGIEEGEIYSDGLCAYANVNGTNYDWKIYVP